MSPTLTRNPPAPLARSAQATSQPRVLLLDACPERSLALRRGLEDSGYPLAVQLADSGRLLKALEAHNPDILVIGTDAPQADLLQQLLCIRDLCPRPIVMFAEKEAPRLIEEIVRCGVSAFVVNDIQAHRLRPIITIAVERFRQTQDLRGELESTRTQLAERKIIERAKGLLMQQRGLSEDEAYQALRKMAMDRGRSLAAVADSVLDILGPVSASDSQQKL